MTTFTTQDRQDAQRTPLTLEEMMALWAPFYGTIGNYGFKHCIMAFARAIERAHGIGE